MGQLVLRHEESGYRHYVDDKPVHAGSFLEVMTADGSWLSGRYEWSFHADAKPYLVVGDDETMPLDADSIVRWPKP